MPLKNTRIIISLIAMLTAFLYAQDGPYFFYTDKADSVISVSADLNNVISADTIKAPDTHFGKWMRGMRNNNFIPDPPR
jgi:hypothetical protein